MILKENTTVTVCVCAKLGQSRFKSDAWLCNHICLSVICLLEETISRCHRILLKVDQTYACTFVLLTYTKRTNNNGSNVTKKEAQSSVRWQALGGRKVTSTLTQDAVQSLAQLFIFQTCKPWKIYPWARPHRDILRLPNAPCSLFLLFLNWHCHALTSQGCMISPSPFQLQYPSAVETARLHLHIPNNPALNNERFAI